MNPYVDFCIAVQAVRRQSERLRGPLMAATGVAAATYTHQLANVERVLTDLRVRHLLADEVGLGKTVQALMVLNALRCSRPDLTALVVVPDTLVGQWRDEILTRAHSAPLGEAAEFTELQFIRLAWEGQLRAQPPKWSLADIDPDKYDVLIVDEMHELRSDLQSRIVRVAPDFAHLLVLTATPAFQEPRRHAQLFALLEPERTELARWDVVRSPEGQNEELSVGQDLASWPSWAIERVVSALMDRDRQAAEGCVDDTTFLQTTALTHCAYRRVIRTRRAMFPGVVPRRRHLPVVVEPLAAEAERQSLMWRYFEHLGNLSIDLEKNLLAKRVILSPPSLEQRIDFLRRKGHERAGLLERVKPLVHRSQGDCRLDALVDLVARIWRENPAERVLVAAQDNLTVDYLFDAVQARLSMVGPLHARVPLVAARIRQGMTTEVMHDLGGHDNPTMENLEAFQRGEAQVLFVPDVAQIGLNLQCARILVLYSVPWSPAEVDQWIGRLDRIGNAAVFSARGEARTVDVYTIAQRGLVDEKVVTVLQRSGVFQRSVNLDGSHLREVTERIEGAALRGESAQWEELATATAVYAAEDDVQELESPLRPYLPWGMEWAQSVRQQFEALPPFGPVLVDLPDYASQGPRSWDRAVEGMIKLLASAKEYTIFLQRDSHGGRFQTLWYTFGDRGFNGRREIRSQVVFPIGADPTHNPSPAGAHAFITRRDTIQTPPRRHVEIRFDGQAVRRPLHFLGFGNVLHDELVNRWAARLQPVSPVMQVAFSAEHPLSSMTKSRWFFVRLSLLDAAQAIPADILRSDVREQIRDMVSGATAEKTKELLTPFMQRIDRELEADTRWLRSHLAASMSVDALMHDGAAWCAVTDDVVRNLLNPIAGGRADLPTSRVVNATEVEGQAASEAVQRLEALDPSAAPRAWSHLYPRFDAALHARIVTARVEKGDADALARTRLEEAEHRLRIAEERGIPGQITRAASLQAEAALRLKISQLLGSARCTWLENCRASVRSLSPEAKGLALIRPRFPQ
jgi:ATP-dependent helicase HepA